jgi:hypothetical protein
MSQPWIKIETVTAEKIEIARVATALGMDRYAVLGRLIRLWGYFDQHSLDGHIDSVNANFIDGLVGHPGFCAQLVAVGWMEIDDAGITLPNFDRHNGATAKSRALAAQRLEKHRGSKRCKRNAAPLHEALPEKRRVEEKREEEKSPLPPEGDGQQKLLPFPTSEGAGNDNTATAAILADEWEFYRAGPKGEAEKQRAHSTFVEMARQGYPLGQISAAIQEKTRNRREAVWTFAERLMESAGLSRGENDKGKGSILDGVSSADAWAKGG